MRINQFVAQATGLSRRLVDELIKQGRVSINGQAAVVGQDTATTDSIKMDNRPVSSPNKKTILLINKPTGYVCSKNGQGSPTIYDLIPQKYHRLKYVGRLDKDSSGLIVLTDNGQLAHRLSHPSFDKPKIYEVSINKALEQNDRIKIEGGRIKLDNRPSLMKITRLSKDGKSFTVEIHEGRNRQIRRTFNKLGYLVTNLKRTALAQYKLEVLGGKTFLEAGDG